MGGFEEMILGIGTDIVEISRIERSITKFGDDFLNKVFSEKEIKIAGKKPASHFAKRFAAKESFSKAIGLGIGRGVNFKDVEISNDEFGKPEINLSKKAQDFLQGHFKKESFKIDLSLSDTKENAVAFVVISI
ncbi:MAG: holo-[acyl-carrier protein] synthase [Lentimonas sp.]|jgi:holo-[acyl-carrier protein] synthase